MKNTSDKRAPKAIFLAIIIIFFYLAFFSFNIERAYTYTVNETVIMLQLLGILDAK